MIPITRDNAKYELAALTIEAIRTRSMQWTAMLMTVLRDMGGYVLEQVGIALAGFACRTNISFKS